MQLRWIQLVPAALILFLSACFPLTEKRNFPEKNGVESLPLYENIENSIPQETPPPLPFWDTTKIDLSDVDDTRKLISFTFDDAPSRTLENILAVFSAFNEKNPDCKASATVFVNGKRFDKQTPHLLHAALALGFELGNHTQTHSDLTKLSDEEILEEIAKTDSLLSRIDGNEKHLLRAPFGKIDDRVKALSPTPLIDWTIDTLDWTGISEKDIYESVFQGRFPGAIVLMHDGYEHTVSALKRLLPDLKSDGYQVVSVSKMAKSHGCRLQNGKVYIRARKQN